MAGNNTSAALTFLLPATAQLVVTSRSICVLAALFTQ